MATTLTKQTSQVDDAIRIVGARVHNLKDVHLQIPSNQLVVITGPSGSGKSSLAFDTLYAEGQRQYVETLSVYVRQFLHQMERPDVDLIEGLQPTICIDQRVATAHPRSTVATVTEIYDYLRLMMARLGQVACFRCGNPIRQQTAGQVEDHLLRFPEKTKVMILAPLVRGRRGAHLEVIQRIRKLGFVRARIDGEVFEVEQVPPLNPRRNHTIEAIVDRIIIRPGAQERIAESIRLAIQHGEGLVSLCFQQPHQRESDQWEDQLFNTLYACPDCGVSYEELEPRTFSFNSPYGACRTCDGIGRLVQFEPELVIADRSLSLAQGAVAPWKGLSATHLEKRQAELTAWRDRDHPRWQQPLDEWSASLIEELMNGNSSGFIGLLNVLEKEYATTTRSTRLEQLEPYRGSVVCSACDGTRLRTEANHVYLGSHSIGQITALSIDDAREFFDTLGFDEQQQLISQPLVTEITKRLTFLQKVGVGYLTLDRAADTLSGGERQRVRLATGIGSGLVGVCYVLDEPSIGLHPRDNDRLIRALRQLQQQGNTVLVVEHDEAMMRQADYLIDIGPGAGALGGRVVAEGTIDDVMQQPDSITGQYLSGQQKIAVPAKRRKTAKSRSIEIQGVSTNNLKQVDIRFPLAAMVCVTGVSGSGKSSLINETLVPAIRRRLGGMAPRPGPHTGLRGINQIDKLIEIDQQPIGRTPRSNAATFTGIFDEVRKVFATTRQAKQLGFRATRFSFNNKSGRCDHCEGHGVKRIEMNFLPDLFVTCQQCDGQRFNRQTLQVRYRDKTIADVLEMSIEEALGFFENFEPIRRSLQSLADVGLGYLPLGQPSTSLSGGEAQRIKLANQLARVSSGKTVYVLDEPTTGLHVEDTRRLLAVLNQLVDKGNTVIIIEHHLDVMKCSDWMIDLGPEGGKKGGHLVVEGTPEQVASHPTSETGRFLAPVLAGGK